MIPMLV